MILKTNGQAAFYWQASYIDIYIKTVQSITERHSQLEHISDENLPLAAFTSVASMAVKSTGDSTVNISISSFEISGLGLIQSTHACTHTHTHNVISHKLLLKGNQIFSICICRGLFFVLSLLWLCGRRSPESHGEPTQTLRCWRRARVAVAAAEAGKFAAQSVPRRPPACLEATRAVFPKQMGSHQPMLGFHLIPRCRTWSFSSRFQALCRGDAVA